MKKILLINASRYFFDEGQNLLERKDFQVFLAPSARHALQIHRQERVNLIVSDLLLPEMAGDELCNRIREDSDSRNVSFILVCHNTPEELARARKCGANVCLQKPFTARSLLEQVEKLLAVSIRKGYRVLLRVKVKGTTDDCVFFCTSQNISVSGLLIETEKQLPNGSQITCSFFLPGAAQIVVDGEVVRTESLAGGLQMHYGIRFTNIAAEHQRAIEHFISGTLT